MKRLSVRLLVVLAIAFPIVSVLRSCGQSPQGITQAANELEDFKRLSAGRSTRPLRKWLGDKKVVGVLYVYPLIDYREKDAHQKVPVPSLHRNVTEPHFVLVRGDISLRDGSRRCPGVDIVADVSGRHLANFLDWQSKFLKNGYVITYFYVHSYAVPQKVQERARLLSRDVLSEYVRDLRQLAAHYPALLEIGEEHVDLDQLAIRYRFGFDGSDERCSVSVDVEDTTQLGWDEYSIAPITKLRRLGVIIYLRVAYHEGSSPLPSRPGKAEFVGEVTRLLKERIKPLEELDRSMSPSEP